MFGGFLVKWTSKENCGSGKFQLEALVECDKAENTVSAWESPSSNQCKIAFRAKSHYGCELYDFGSWQSFMRFLGALDLLCGIYICFVSLKFVAVAVTILTIKLCIFIAFGVAYSFELINLNDSNIMWGIICLAGGSLIGIGLSCKLAMNGNWLSVTAKPVVALWAGITLCYIILAPIGLMNLIKMCILGGVSFLFMTISGCYK